MDMKEAIKFIGSFKEVVTSIDIENGEGEAIEEYNGKIDKVIGFLQRGEKYEQMFNTILNWTIHDGSFIPAKELINLEQKYFPKPKEEVIK